MDSGLLLVTGIKPRILYRDAEPSLPFHPQLRPSAELCRRGSCYTLIRGDSDNREQLSHPARGAPCARTALPGASLPAIPVPPRAPRQRSRRAPAGHGRAPGARSAAGKRSCRPQPRGRCCSSAGSLPESPARPVWVQGVRCVHRHGQMGGEAGAPLLLLLLLPPGVSWPLPARWYRTPPGRTCCPPPPSPRPAAHTKAAARPPTAPGAPPSPPPALMEPPGDAARDRRGRGAGGRGDTRTRTRLWRSCARPPSPGPAARSCAGTLLLGGRSPLTRPHVLRAALTHRGRTERVPARTERRGRRRAQSPQRLPLPPPAPSPYTLPALSDTAPNQSTPAGT